MVPSFPCTVWCHLVSCGVPPFRGVMCHHFLVVSHMVPPMPSILCGATIPLHLVWCHDSMVYDVVPPIPGIIFGACIPCILLRHALPGALFHSSFHGILSGAIILWNLVWCCHSLVFHATNPWYIVLPFHFIVLCNLLACELQPCFLVSCVLPPFPGI